MEIKVQVGRPIRKPCQQADKRPEHPEKRAVTWQRKKRPHLIGISDQKDLIMKHCFV